MTIGLAGSRAMDWRGPVSKCACMPLPVLNSMYFLPDQYPCPMYVTENSLIHVVCMLINVVYDY